MQNKLASRGSNGEMGAAEQSKAKQRAKKEGATTMMRSFFANEASRDALIAMRPVVVGS